MIKRTIMLFFLFSLPLFSELADVKSHLPELFDKFYSQNSDFLQILTEAGLRKSGAKIFLHTNWQIFGSEISTDGKKLAEEGLKSWLSGHNILLEPGSEKVYQDLIKEMAASDLRSEQNGSETAPAMEQRFLLLHLNFKFRYESGVIFMNVSGDMKDTAAVSGSGLINFQPVEYGFEPGLFLMLSRPHKWAHQILGQRHFILLLSLLIFFGGISWVKWYRVYSQRNISAFAMHVQNGLFRHIFIPALIFLLCSWFLWLIFGALPGNFIIKFLVGAGRNPYSLFWLVLWITGFILLSGTWFMPDHKKSVSTFGENK